jgi:hypothetical protein
MNNTRKSEILKLVDSVSKEQTYDEVKGSFTLEEAAELGFKLIDASATTSARLIGLGKTIWLRDGGGSSRIEIRECTSDKVVTYNKQEYDVPKGKRAAYLCE